MKKTDNLKTYHKLRNKYPCFIYEGFEVTKESNYTELAFLFNLSDKYFFKPRLKLFLNDDVKIDNLSESLLENIFFHIGMIEMLSYWKATCSPRIIIRNYKLNNTQLSWWKKLYYHGLGEFFYLNGIKPDLENFVVFENDGKQKLERKSLKLSDSNLIPMGGGKDSAVTYELLSKAFEDNTLFFLNPGQIATEVAHANGQKPKTVVVERTICPQLLALNKKGFLNGHTPFSAVLSFISLWVAACYGTRHLVLSNESSANESTVVGTKINHQYSKSFEYEYDFRLYTSQYISPDFNYFSFLRPVNELQIGCLFGRMPSYFSVFRSCNVGSKKGVWCGHCPKCLFTYIILAPFIKENNMIAIFGKNLLEDHSLKETFMQLVGLSSTKPFECIGTIKEVNTALCMIIKQSQSSQLPLLLSLYTETENYKHYIKNDDKLLLEHLNHKHFLPEPHLEVLLRALKRSTKHF